MRITNKLELIVAVGTPGWMIRVRIRPNRRDESLYHYHAACAERSQIVMGSGGPAVFTRYAGHTKRVDGLAIPEHAHLQCTKCKMPIRREEPA